jgi:hypothetical protein
MSCVGYEPTIPASKRAKTVHALDRSATVTGYRLYMYVITIYPAVMCTHIRQTRVLYIKRKHTLNAGEYFWT